MSDALIISISGGLLVLNILILIYSKSIDKKILEEKFKNYDEKN